MCTIDSLLPSLHYNHYWFTAYWLLAHGTELHRYLITIFIIVDLCFWKLPVISAKFTIINIPPVFIALMELLLTYKTTSHLRSEGTVFNGFFSLILCWYFVGEPNLLLTCTGKLEKIYLYMSKVKGNR